MPDDRESDPPPPDNPGDEPDPSSAATAIPKASDGGASRDDAKSASNLSEGSGSIDVAVSMANLPAAKSEPIAPVDDKAKSGSIDVAVSMANLPTAKSGPIAPVDDTAKSGSIDIAVTGPLASIPAAVPALESKPHKIPGTGRGQRLTAGVKDVVGGGVSKLGSGIEQLGGGVSRVGEKAKMVPIVGSGVSMIGESLTSVGESLTELPRVAKTRRGRLLVRSMLVAFVLVFAWISIIVALQVRGTDIFDFRPDAHRILLEIDKGGPALEELYESASPRFQEMVRKEQFIDDMTDLRTTLGKYIEIAAVNDTLVSNAPTGKVGRVTLTVRYEKGKSMASVGLHLHDGKWKLLGIGVELPPDLQISQAQREERVLACKDPMDARSCDVFVAANTILEQLRDGQAGQVWDAATSVFQKQEERGRFMALQESNQRTLGDFKRIILVTEAKVLGGTIATYDIVTEYAKSYGVRAIFGFYRRVKSDPWKLRSLKIVLPMPRLDERGSGSDAGSGSAVEPVPAPTPPPPQPRPNTGSAGSGSGSVKPAMPPAGSNAPGSGSGSAAPSRAPKVPAVKVTLPNVLGSGSTVAPTGSGSGSGSGSAN